MQSPHWCYCKNSLPAGVQGPQTPPEIFDRFGDAVAVPDVAELLCLLSYCASEAVVQQQMVCAQASVYLYRSIPYNIYFVGIDDFGVPCQSSFSLVFSVRHKNPKQISTLSHLRHGRLSPPKLF